LVFVYGAGVTSNPVTRKLPLPNRTAPEKSPFAGPKEAVSSCAKTLGSRQINSALINIYFFIIVVL
jgi:hypothetical protein